MLLKSTLVYVGLLPLFYSNSCTSLSPKILERADNLSSTPEWASVTRSAYEETGKQYFVGYVSLNDGASKSAALNMADEKALSEPMRAIVSSFLDQNQVGESLSQGESVSQRVISATRGYRPPMPGLKIVKRYWESVLLPTTNAGQKIELRVYALSEISTKEYEEAKKAALDHLNGNSEVKNILRDVGEKQRAKILDQE